MFMLTLVFVSVQAMTKSELVGKLWSYIWPAGSGEEEAAVRRRVVRSGLLMFSSKLINTSVPFIFSQAVDSLSSPETVVPAVVMGTLAGYGVARASALGCGELRNAVFSKVSQHSIRKIGRSVFLHLHDLDLTFHLNRQTGALSKTIDRGSRPVFSTTIGRTMSRLGSHWSIASLVLLALVICAIKNQLVASKPPTRGFGTQNTLY